MSTFSCPIVTIKSVEKHPNADSLEIISFNECGWICCDKPGRKIGDMVVYIPIDANVDTNRPEFEFLKPRAKSNGLCRIKTIKLRQEISQGLCFDLPNELVNNEVGFDCSEYFGITKYEPPQEQVFSANAKGNFPSWCPKTDAERYQNCNRTIQPYQNNLWYQTLKLDGTSLTVFYDATREGDEFGVCSRNQELKKPEFDDESSLMTKYGFSLDVYWKCAIQQNLLNWCKETAEFFGCKRLALQCEVCGPGIQGNKLGLPITYAYAFDVYVCKDEFDNGHYLDYETFYNLGGIDKVPLIKIESLSNKMAFVDLNFDWIHELKYENGHPAEGVVYVMEGNENIGKLGRAKFKYINPVFLLKEKD